jgi:prefoldin subunit 5
VVVAGLTVVGSAFVGWGDTSARAEWLATTIAGFRGAGPEAGGTLSAAVSRGQRLSPEELRERAAVLKKEAAQYDAQIKVLNDLLKPWDDQAAELRRQADAWAKEAAGYRDEASRIERNTQQVQDPAPRIQQTAARLRDAGTSLRGTRNQLVSAFGADKAGAVDAVLKQQGIDLDALAGALTGAGDKLAPGATADQLDGQIARLEHDVLDPLKVLRKTAQASYDESKRHFDAAQPPIDKKMAEITWWEGEREKHQRNANQAADEYNQSCRTFLGITTCTNLGAWAWYVQASTGVAQADSAIGLDWADINVRELSRVGDRLEMNVLASTGNVLQQKIDDVERQVQSLKDASAAVRALADNKAKAGVVQQKRQLAAQADFRAEAARKDTGAIYQPVAGQVTERQSLTKRRDGLLKQARELEQPPRLRGGGNKLG